MSGFLYCCGFGPALAHPEQGGAGHCGGHHQNVDEGNHQREVSDAAKAQALPAFGAQPGKHVLPAHLVVIRRVVDVQQKPRAPAVDAVIQRPFPRE